MVEASIVVGVVRRRNGNRSFDYVLSLDFANSLLSPSSISDVFFRLVLFFGHG